MVNTKLSDSVHTLAYLWIHAADVPTSQEIANSINTNPVVVRRLMTNLKASGFIDTTRGSKRVQFLKQPGAINLYDLFIAVDHRHLFDLDDNTNQEDPIGRHLPGILETHYRETLNVTAAYMRSVTLAQVIAELQAADD